MSEFVFISTIEAKNKQLISFMSSLSVLKMCP